MRWPTACLRARDEGWPLPGLPAILVDATGSITAQNLYDGLKDRLRLEWLLGPAGDDALSISRDDLTVRPAAVGFLNLIHPNMSQMDLTDYGERYIRDQLAVVPGVSQVTMEGLGRPSMRIWLDRVALAARNLTVIDIENALRRENIDLPAGRITVDWGLDY